MSPEQEALPESNAAAIHLLPRLFSVAKEPAIYCTLQRNNRGASAGEWKKGVFSIAIVVLEAMTNDRDDPGQKIYQRVNKKKSYLPFDYFMSAAEVGVLTTSHIFRI